MNKWIVKWLFKPKFVVVELIKQQLGLHEISRKSYNAKTFNRWIETKKKKTIMDIGNPAIIRDNIRFYFIDKETGNPYSFSEFKNPMSKDEIDILVGNRVFRDIVRSVMDTMRDKIMFFCLGLIIGGLIGFMIATYIKQAEIDKLNEEIRNMQPVIFNWIQMRWVG